MCYELQDNTIISIRNNNIDNQTIHITTHPNTKLIAQLVT